MGRLPPAPPEPVCLLREVRKLVEGILVSRLEADDEPGTESHFVPIPQLDVGARATVGEGTTEGLAVVEQQLPTDARGEPELHPSPRLKSHAVCSDFHIKTGEDGVERTLFFHMIAVAVAADKDFRKQRRPT